MVDRWRLPEVYPADVGPTVEPLDPRHAEGGGLAGHPEVGAVSEGGRLGPEVRPLQGGA